MFKSFILFLVLCLPVPAYAQDILFSNSFEQGQSGWTAIRSSLPIMYPTAGCHTGMCGQMSLRAGVAQQSVLWEKSVNVDGDKFYISAWFKFPKGYSWDPAPGYSGTEHKLIIVSTGDSVGRILLNLRGGGATPTLQIHFEKLEGLGGVSTYTNTQWPADGEWHLLELFVNRVSGVNGRVGIWLDAKLILDSVGAVCGTPCTPVVGFQIGAFVNQGSAKAQSFFVDDVTVARSRPNQIVMPDPVSNNIDEMIKQLESVIIQLKSLKGN